MGSCSKRIDDSAAGVRFPDLFRRDDVAYINTRREFIRDLGIGAASLPFILNLPSLGFANQERRKKRLVVMFSPDGIIPPAFWPDEVGEGFTFKEIMKPLEPFQKKTLVLQGV